jgi:hypothetical protein
VGHGIVRRFDIHFDGHVDKEVFRADGDAARVLTVYRRPGERGRPRHLVSSKNSRGRKESGDNGEETEMLHKNHPVRRACRTAKKR